MKNLKNVECYEKYSKEYFLEEAKEIAIDNVMKPLYSAINSIDDLVAVNDDEIVISFIVINNNYKTANDLIVYLKNKFGNVLDCRIQFITYDTADIDENGKFIIPKQDNQVGLFYTIEFNDTQDWEVSETTIINNVAKEITDFGKEYNKKPKLILKLLNR